MSRSLLLDIFIFFLLFLSIFIVLVDGSIGFMVLGGEGIDIISSGDPSGVLKGDGEWNRTYGGPYK